MQGMSPHRDATGPYGARRPRAIGIALYLACYIALDWISLTHTFGALLITPWNPPAGLSLALLLRYGSRFAPAYFAAIILADTLFRGLFRGLAAVPLATAFAALVIVIGYTAAAELLRRKLLANLRLDGHRDLLWFLGVVLASTMAVACIVVAIFAAAGLLDWSAFAEAALHFWVGDVIGIAVLTPFLLLLDRQPWRERMQWRRVAEYALQLAAIAGGLWLIFGLESTDHFEFSYVLFLPLIWIALRTGLKGATWGIVATQLGLVLAIQLKGYDATILTQFQLLMLTVAVTGLLLGSVVDERQRAETSLRESQARLQTVVSTAPDAIFAVAEDGIIMAANHAAEQMFGAGTRQLVGSSAQSLLPGIQPLASAATAGGELTAHRLDGSSFIAELAVGVARTDGRSIYVAIARDISARKEAERRLKEHEAELAHAARLTATGEMAAALAHEINQPLTALISFARACQALLESPAGDASSRDKAVALIEQTVQQAIRAGEIIRRTREFLRRGDTRPAKTEPTEICAAVLDLVRSEAIQGRVRITTEFARDLPAIFADPIQIEQVLLNLVRNSMEALKSVDANARAIVIAAARSSDDPEMVELAVRDTGPGFPAEIAARLFSPFSTTKDSGMGLGLAISRTIIEAHGGRIWVNGASRGADVRFTLPAYTEQTEEETEETYDS